MNHAFISPLSAPRRAVTAAGQRRRVERAEQIARAMLLDESDYRQEARS